MSALEDRDAQLSSYADHVETLEHRIRDGEGAVDKVKGDLKEALAEVLEVRAVVLTFLSLPRTSKFIIAIFLLFLDLLFLSLRLLQ